MTEEGKITITRGSAYVDRARAYKIILDGREVGRIKNGTTESISVPAGPHELYLKVDWVTSPTMRFDLAPGEEARFTTLPKGNPLTALGYALFTPKSYLRLNRDKGGV